MHLGYEEIKQEKMKFINNHIVKNGSQGMQSK